jgi:hypothetical protein
LSCIETIATVQNILNDVLAYRDIFKQENDGEVLVYFRFPENSGYASI